MEEKLKDIKIGLVLSGGGAKGAYEAGVIAALWDLNLTKNIKVVSGTSIGVINALLFCMDNRAMLEKCWRTINYAQFVTFKEILKSNILSELFHMWKTQNQENENESNSDDEFHDIGMISQNGVREFIKKYVDMKKLKESPIDLYGCAFHVKNQQPAYFKMNDHTEEEIIDIALASCAIPHMFPPIEINGESYVDGGYHNPFVFEYKVDNVPVKPLKEYELDFMIIVHLDYLDEVDYRLYKDTTVIEIFPTTPLELLNGMGTLNFLTDTIHKRLDLGYRDALVTLSPIFLAYARGENLTNYLSIHRKKNVELLKKYKPRPMEFIRFLQENKKTINKKEENNKTSSN